jgi:hypothetical protein
MLKFLQSKRIISSLKFLNEEIKQKAIVEYEKICFTIKVDIW